MTGDEIKATVFPVRARGYPRSAVRSELARIADLQENGWTQARFVPPGRPGWQGRAYDTEAVDRFFAKLAYEAQANLRVMPEVSGGPRYEGHTLDDLRQYKRDREAEWQGVYDLPGMRLVVARGTLTGSAGEVLATRRRNMVTLVAGQVLRIDKDEVGGRVTDLSTGEPLLWIRGRHFYPSAGLYVLLPGQRCFVFPVTGSLREHAVMTAVTESGATALWIRYHPTAAGKQEIVVSPDLDLSPEILCIANLAAAWLATYFLAPEASAGGG